MKLTSLLNEQNPTSKEKMLGLIVIWDPILGYMLGLHVQWLLREKQMCQVVSILEQNLHAHTNC
jgi:hypothetical protein